MPCVNQTKDYLHSKKRVFLPVLLGGFSFLTEKSSSPWISPGNTTAGPEQFKPHLQAAHLHPGMPRIQSAPRPTTKAVSRGTAPQRLLHSSAQQLAFFKHLFLTPFILLLSKMLLECKKLPHLPHLGDTECHGGFLCYENLAFFSYTIHP